ncbi:MAG: glycosyltransferase [Desulfobacterales bacterium]|nr:glycosyltransferase [Desulfobacterales bacterium]
MSMVRSHLPGSSQWPHIDCVIIGVNCAQTLARCLASIQSADYPTERLHIYYADGGSIDSSLEIAARVTGVTIISLSPEYPTPGLGRNRGWQKGASPIVQFLDSDTLLDPGWLKKGVSALDGAAVGAVLGLRQEMHPHRSLFNWIGDIEWNGPAGEADCFGGDVMMRRKVLEAAGGYDEVLVGGEDPELSRRVIRAGWRIVRLPVPMTRHDLAMTRIGQYLKRAFRSGYGFAAVRERESRQKSDFWRHEMRKIVIRGGGFVLFSLLGMLLMFSESVNLGAAGMGCLAAGICLLLRPRLFLINKFRRLHSLSRQEANRYAWHCSVVVVPQLLGVVRFYWGKWLKRPLRNRRRLPSTASTGPQGIVL